MASIVLLRALLLSMSLSLLLSSSRGTEVNVCSDAAASPCEQGACNDSCSKRFVYGLCHHNESDNAVECCCETGINDPPEKVPTKLCKKQADPCDQRVCNDHCQSQPFNGVCLNQNGKSSCCCVLSD